MPKGDSSDNRKVDSHSARGEQGRDSRDASRHEATDDRGSGRDRRFEIVALEVGGRALALQSATLTLHRDDSTRGAAGPTTWAIEFLTRDIEPPQSGEYQIAARLADGRELRADATLEATDNDSCRLVSIGGFGGMEEW